MELVMAVDVSTSVNNIEFRAQLEGMAAAFEDSEVIDLIVARQHGVAVLVTLWGGSIESAVPMPWRVLRTRQDVEAYARDLLRIRRANLGYLTAIGHAIKFATNAIETNAYEGAEKKIDVSGDGHSNSGPDPWPLAVRALKHGIVINGLAIGNVEDTLMSYYERNVIIGDGSFVEYAADFEDFATAFRRKLKRELSPKLAGGGAGRHLADLGR